MLTLQLRELEADKVITRQAYREVPPRVEYSLTELGKTLEPVLLSLRDWAINISFGKMPANETASAYLGSLITLTLLHP